MLDTISLSNGTDSNACRSGRRKRWRWHHQQHRCDHRSRERESAWARDGWRDAGSL